MKGVRNSSGALAALLAAGGLFAWRNRDKIQGWVNTQRSKYNVAPADSGNMPMTGETRRISSDEYPSFGGPSNSPENSDASI